jgi:hypothetical protein
LKCQSNALRPGYLPGIVITGYIETTNIVVLYIYIDDRPYLAESLT